MTDTAFKRAQKFDTRMRSLDRAEEAVHESVRMRYAEKRRAMRGELDAEAHAIVEAAELARAKQSKPSPIDIMGSQANATNIMVPGPMVGDERGGLSPRLLENPGDAPKPIETEPKAKAGRR